MKHAIAPRVTGEVCLTLLLYCILFASDGMTVLTLAAFAAAVLVCGVAAAHFERFPVRLLCCLPPLFLLFAANRPELIVVLAVCWLYAAIRFSSGKFSIRYWVYRREFAVLTFACVVASVVIAAGIGPVSAVAFAAASVLLGIYALRVIRLELPEEPGWSAYSAAELLLPLGVAVGISALFWLFLNGLFYGLKWLFGLMDKPYTPKPSDVSGIPVQHIPFIPGKTPGQNEEYEFEMLEELSRNTKPVQTDLVHSVPPYVWLILILAFILLVSLVVFLVVRKARKKKKALTEEETESETGKRGKTKKGAAASPARRVRAAYRSYLYFLQQRGQTIRKSDTSQDVLDASGPTGSGEDERELRALYLNARYEGGSSLSDTDAMRAEELARSICGG